MFPMFWVWVAMVLQFVCEFHVHLEYIVLYVIVRLSVHEDTALIDII